MSHGRIRPARLIDQSGRIYRLDRPVLTLGRTGCDIVLVDNTVAPTQARFRVGPHEVMITEVAGNTRLNGRPLDQTGNTLQRGDQVTFGNRTLTFDE